MLDDLRNSSSYLNEDEPPAKEEEAILERPSRKRKEPFLGLTPQQRFIVSLVIFMMVCLLGVIALVISGSVNLPF